MANARILAVDDSPTILEMIKAILVSGGYEVITAADGAEALETARAEMPDLILLDVMLPEARRLPRLPAAQVRPEVQGHPDHHAHGQDRGAGDGHRHPHRREPVPDQADRAREAAWRRSPRSSRKVARVAGAPAMAGHRNHLRTRPRRARLGGSHHRRAARACPRRAPPIPEPTAGRGARRARSRHARTRLANGARGRDWACPRVDLASYAPDDEALALVPGDVARARKVLPLFEIEGMLTVAIGDPIDVFALDDARRASSASRSSRCSPTRLRCTAAICQYYGPRIGSRGRADRRGARR